MKKLLSILALFSLATLLLSQDNVIVVRHKVAAVSSSPISRDGYCSTSTTTSCTLSATATGSLKVVFAYRSASVTPPSLPATWTNVQTQATAASGVVGSYRIGCNLAANSGDTGTGTWTNATDVAAVSYSGTEVKDAASCASLALGALAVNAAKTSTTLDYPALTPQITDGTSWVAGLAGNSTGGICAPASGMPQFTTAANIHAVTGNDTNTGVATWGDATCSITGGSGTWMSSVLEIFGKTPPTYVPSVVAASSSSSGGSSIVSDPTSYNQATVAGNALVVFFFHDTCTGSNCGTSTISDTLSNTWHPCSGTGTGAFTDVLVMTGVGASCFYVVNGIGGADTVTVIASVCASNCGFLGGYYTEVTNIATTAAGAFDAAPVYKVSGTSTTTPNNMSSSAMTIAAPGEIVFFAVDNASGTPSGGTSPTRFNFMPQTGVMGLEWASWGGSGSLTPTMTLNSSGVGYGGFSFALKHK